MKKLALTIAILAAAPLAASADVSKEDIKKLAAAGVGEEVILAFIRSNGPVVRLSAEDIVELKQAGAGERVLAAVLGGGSAPAPRTQIVEQTRIVEKPVYVPSTTYVVDSSPVYYAPSWYSSSYYWPSYYYSSCAPRYSYSSYCAPRLGVTYYSGSRCTPRSTWGVSIRR